MSSLHRIIFHLHHLHRPTNPSEVIFPPCFVIISIPNLNPSISDNSISISISDRRPNSSLADLAHYRQLGNVAKVNNYDCGLPYVECSMSTMWTLGKVGRNSNNQQSVVA